MLVLLAACAQTVWLEDPPMPDLVTTCETGPRKSASLPVAFPQRDASCAWGEGGNLDPAQGVVTARAEESATLDLGRVAICDVGFDFRAGDGGADPVLAYDDGFLLTFGNVVLAASYAPLMDAFEADGLLRLYDWDRMVGLPFEAIYDETYCLGEAEGQSACSIPRAETPGPIALEFGDPVVDALAERAYAEGRYDFTFVTFGDNDYGADCTHTAFAFTVDLTYVPP